MSRFKNFSSGTAAFLALGMAASVVAPIVISAPATAATSFSDVRNHWARPFIETLAQERIINGFPDGTFKPDKPVTRGEFAALVQAAFRAKEIRQGIRFKDVSLNYWAGAAIQRAYKTGFMTGYTNGDFHPEQKIPRVQALVSLASGLEIQPKGTTQDILRNYRDANNIPNYALDKVAAATEKGIVVNYPNLRYLNPNDNATRADVAAFIYQALVNQGKLDPISSNLDASKYIVDAGTGNTTSSYNQSQTPRNTTNLRVPRGRQIDVAYQSRNHLVITPGETVNITLAVASDIKNARGDVLISKNSQIQGRLVPRYNGSQFMGAQFVADSLIVGNKSYDNINATSSLITAQSPTTVNTGILQNSAVSAAAQVLLGRVTGQQFNIGDILGSVLTGQATNNPQQQNQVIVIEPEKDLTLTLGSDFYVNDIADIRTNQ